MRNTISKAIVAGVAALSLATAVVATTEPASAGQWHGGGFGGGWHGGGFGGWHGGGGGWRGGGWHGGWAGGGGRYWHPGYWNGGRWYGGWWGPAVVAGLAAGAHRHLSLLGLRRLRRQLLAGSPGLRRLRQPTWRPAGQRLPVIKTVQRIERGLAQAGPFLFSALASSARRSSVSGRRWSSGRKAARPCASATLDRRSTAPRSRRRRSRSTRPVRPRRQAARQGGA